METTFSVLRRYLKGHATDVLAEAAVFKMMGSGEEFHGREAIDAMLEGF